MTDTIVNGTPPLSPSFLFEMIARAVNAPSGDNSQPWRFRLEDDSIILLNVPNADSTLYNFRQRGSYFAHGAIIENLSILAGEKGYRIETALFPDFPDATSRITFVPNEPVTTGLASAIELRSTNRKPYQITPLEVRHKTALIGAVRETKGVELRFMEEREGVDALARTVSVNERLLMENRPLHDFLFSMIRWTREEEKLAPGLFLKTMELPPPVQFLFRFLLRYWAAVKVLNVIGLSRFIPTQSAPVYRASSAFGAVVITGMTNADFVSAGRAFERMWLTATANGIRVQPVTAIPYLAQRVEEGEASAFSPIHQQMIVEANRRVSEAFHLSEGEHIAMLFRVGYGDAPTATSAKAPPVMVESN